MLDGERASLIEGGATHTQHTVDPEGRVLWDGNNAIASVVMTANAPRAKASVMRHEQMPPTMMPSPHDPTLHRWTTQPQFFCSLLFVYSTFLHFALGRSMGFDAGWVDQVRSSKHLLNGGTCIDARIGNTYSMSHARPFGERMVCASGFFARSVGRKVPTNSHT